MICNWGCVLYVCGWVIWGKRVHACMFQTSLFYHWRQQKTSTCVSVRYWKYCKGGGCIPSVKINLLLESFMCLHGSDNVLISEIYEYLQSCYGAAFWDWICQLLNHLWLFFSDLPQNSLRLKHACVLILDDWVFSKVISILR